MREQQKSFWDADNDTIKEVQSKEGVQGVVRKPLIDLTRIGETNEISVMVSRQRSTVTKFWRVMDA